MSGPGKAPPGGGLSRRSRRLILCGLAGFFVWVGLIGVAIGVIQGSGGPPWAWILGGAVIVLAHELRMAISVPDRMTIWRWLNDRAYQAGAEAEYEIRTGRAAESSAGRAPQAPILIAKRDAYRAAAIAVINRKDRE